ncbi:hypothetical protein N8J89_19545 [Crossiella sp. CA-258035]|uniref:hypothetical protein n=1 Tax=Crossiella sp. CA-258035 TaxID=2981138 RepID=UPI0024BC9DA1|nr:hypothetical protein [Crossiella sp. CA-258035]WHT23183.1 hypothetical protein N8J89_19545 [Crossiella sp. CA-258035]
MSKRIRQFHRWLAIAFTVTIIITTIGLAQQEPAIWLSYLPLFPLALLLFSGLYLFALPYTAKSRAARRLARTD